MKELKRIAIISPIILWVALTGCSTVSVHYLPTDPPSSYPPTDSIEVFWEKPARQHVLLGMVFAECEEKDRALQLKNRALLIKEMKKKAMKAGAQGIIIKDTPAQTETAGGPPAGTMHRLEAYAIKFKNKSTLAAKTPAPYGLSR